MNIDKQIQQELKKLGMQETTGAGWYVTILVDGEPLKVWATDIEDEVAR